MKKYIVFSLLLNSCEPLSIESAATLNNRCPRTIATFPASTPGVVMTGLCIKDIQMQFKASGWNTAIQTTRKWAIDQTPLPPAGGGDGSGDEGGGKPTCKTTGVHEFGEWGAWEKWQYFGAFSPKWPDCKQASRVRHKRCKFCGGPSSTQEMRFYGSCPEEGPDSWVQEYYGDRPTND